MGVHNLARTIKDIYHPVTDFFTCLYISNKCANDCSYCSFGYNNSGLERKTLISGQVRGEARFAKQLGHTNIILIAGSQSEKEIKDIVIKSTEILLEEGLNPWIEFDNFSYDTLKHIHELGADHYFLFQETYDKDVYAKIHKNSPLKKDFDSRLRQIDKAINAGFSTIGIGSLFGLHDDYQFEIDALTHHSNYLKDRGVNVIVSMPTLKDNDSFVLDQDIEKIARTIREQIPYASLALTARENPVLRDKLFDIVDLIGCDGATNPGGRTCYKKEYQKGDKQFSLSDPRTLKVIRKHLLDRGIKVK